MLDKEIETADLGHRRPDSVLVRARSFMTPEDEVAARKRRLEQLEAQYAEDGDDGPEAA